MGLRRDEKPITSNNPFEGFVLLEKKNGDTTREQREGLASYSAKGLPSSVRNIPKFKDRANWSRATF